MIPKSVDAVLVTDLVKSREICEAAVAKFGLERILIPKLLRVRISQRSQVAK